MTDVMIAGVQWVRQCFSIAQCITDLDISHAEWEWLCTDARIVVGVRFTNDEDAIAFKLRFQL